MTDLRKAAEMALEALEEVNEMSKPPMGIPLPAEIDGAMDALRTALAQPEQEPVAWMWKDGTVTTDPDYADGTWTPLFTAPPSNPEQGCGECGVKASDGYALYCVKCVLPMKEWIGLTDEEIAEYDARLSGSGVAREIEAKLKERNT